MGPSIFPGEGRFILPRRYLVTLFFVLATANAFGQGTQDVTKAPGTVQYKAESWIEYKPPAARFSVQLPGKPTEEIESIDTAAGKVPMHISLLAVQYKDSFAVCVTAYNDFPSELSDETAVRRVLDNGRDELLAKTSRQLISEKEIQLDSWLGREIRFYDGDVSMIQRSFVVKNRLYQVSIGFPRAADVPRDVLDFQTTVREKIFSSFRVLPVD